MSFPSEAGHTKGRRMRIIGNSTEHAQVGKTRIDSRKYNHYK